MTRNRGIADSSAAAPQNLVLMDKVLSDLISPQNERQETSVSIIISEANRGHSIQLFDKFQHSLMQEKKEAKEQMLQLARTKKTPFAQAVLASAM